MRKVLLIIFFISFNLFSQENLKMPIFLNCEGSKSLKKCFTTSIAEHLIKNTDYSLAKNQNADYYTEDIDTTENNQEVKTEIVNCFFTINYKGKIKKIRIKGNIERNVLKIFKNNLKELPKIKPGTLNGEPTNIPFQLPVFIIQYQ